MQKFRRCTREKMKEQKCCYYSYFSSLSENVAAFLVFFLLLKNAAAIVFFLWLLFLFPYSKLLAKIFDLPHGWKSIINQHHTKANTKIKNILPYLVLFPINSQQFLQHCPIQTSLMSKVELVFIPSPGLSHLVSIVEAAKLLQAHDGSLVITILVMDPFKSRSLNASYTQKISSFIKESPRLRFIDLPEKPMPLLRSITDLFDYIDSQIDHIRQIVSNMIKNSSDSRVAGLVLDIFCTKFTQVAKEFAIPSYVYYASGASSLGLNYDVVSLRYELNRDLTQYKDSETELSVRCFSKPFPAKCLPSEIIDDGLSGDQFLEYFRRIKETKGILINTFYELESYAIESMLTRYDMPRVYTVGPILEANHEELGNDLKNWLDNQEENSVVFLCFGSHGVFDEIQLKEIAKALEGSGRKFLWSLRKPGGKGMIQAPVEYDSFEEVLPEGFLERMKGIGKMIGWAPQAAVLAHAAVGGFVSHCGWNSILESFWFGVPVATLPMFAEQQINAFALVRELGIAEEIRIDYKKDMTGETAAELIPAEEIEAAIRRLMAAAEEGGVRGKVKEMQRKSREGLEEGGSSYKAQIEFVRDVIRNVGLE